MKFNFYKLAIIGILFLALPFQSYASHIKGGNISYVQTGLNQYSVVLTLYRDCAGVQLPSTASIMLSSACHNQNITLSQAPGFPIDVSQTCPTVLSSCQGGTTGIQGIHMHVYEGSITLPTGLTCSDFTLSYNTCCRVGSITNLVNPGSQSMYISTTFNSQIVNNSPVFNFRSLNGNANGINYFDFSTIELDGDSLVYELVPAMTNASTSIGYQSGFSAQNPINSMVSFDQHTGLLTVNPTSVQQAVVVVKVSEYRNGSLIGTVMIDAEILIYNTTNNNPTLTGIDSTSNTTLSVFAGDTIDFNMFTFDADASQNLTLTLNNTFPGVNFSTTTGSHPAGNLFWITDTSMVNSYPYLMSVTVQDNACPLMGSSTKILKIYIKNPDITNVWPGDANNDFVANNFDLLSVGLAYGNTGTARANASLNWVAQPAIDWSSAFPGGVNHKFADCNGDGTIDTNDVPAILQNYGLTHSKGMMPAGNPDLFVLLPDSIEAGETVTAPIKLGADASQLTNIYGLAFTVTYDPSLIDSNSVALSFGSSWIGSNQVDMITLQKDFYSSGQMEVAIARIDHQNASGFGNIASLDLKVQDDIAGKVGDIVKNLTIGITNVRAITKDGQQIPVIGGVDSVMVVQQTIGFKDIEDGPVFHIYPNPANDKLFIDFEKTKARVVYIQNAVGQTLEMISVEKITGNSIDISNLAPGVYFVRAEYGNKLSVTKKVLVF